MTRSRLRRGFAAALAVVGALALPAAAHAAPTQESIVEDEYQMLEPGRRRARAALDDAVALGAGHDPRERAVGRATRPRTTSERTPPAGSTAATPPPIRPAPGTRWPSSWPAPRRAGCPCSSPVTGAGPAWASRCRGSAERRRTCRPRPALFGDFVRAVGTQFPQVTRWSIWNEPNQPGWLSPQFGRVRGAVVPVAADIYRSLARSAIAALRATGHGGDQILLGETAPVGRTTGPLARRPAAPEFFLRELSASTRAAAGSRGRDRAGARLRPAIRASP